MGVGGVCIGRVAVAGARAGARSPSGMQLAGSLATGAAGGSSTGWSVRHAVKHVGNYTRDNDICKVPLQVHLNGMVFVR
jgi:hypothetical protein